MKILIILACIGIAASVDPSPRSVNVALETSFLFEPKDANENISFIKNIKDFLDKLYKILAPQTKYQKKFRSETDVVEQKPERKWGFFDWIKSAGEQFLNMTAPKIEAAASVVQTEVSKVAEQGVNAIKDVLPEMPEMPSFHDVMPDMPSFKANDHGESKVFKPSGDNIKESIKIMLQDDNEALNEVAKKMNQYYTEEEVKKLHKLLRKFTKYLDADVDTSKVIKEIFQVVFLDKYKSLNETAKANLVKDFEFLCDYMKASKNTQLKAQTKKQPSTPSNHLVLPEVQLLFGEILNPSKNPQPLTGENKDLRRTDKKKLKKDEKKKGPTQSQIVVDNLELIVKSLKPQP
ncbi:hypothetical protein B5X24_HaOG206057 [Helicoverpa armigera]|uniref:Uncharacterized protein n=1 Tax=Helicoverpa armigera TaxID=29058 RepID=A0A2W1BKM9_HELAM|nr:hypothetical protein B5X24_HaOG206057 [Helicoverpa armigera]